MANNPPSHKLSLLKKIVLNQKIEPGSEGPPAKGSLIAIEDGKDYPKYQKLWREIFQIR